MLHIARPELVNTANSVAASRTLCSIVVLASRSESASARNPKQEVDPQLGTTIELRHNADKEELTGTSEMKALALTFEAPMTLLSLVLSSLYHGAFHLLS